MSPPNPFLIGPEGGSEPRRETLASELGAGRHFLLAAVRELEASELDALAPACPNSIGSILAHVAAAELMFQNICFRGKRFGPDEEDMARAFRFEANPLAGRDLAAYRALLESLRSDTLRLLSDEGDDWLASPKTIFGKPSNPHYYWLHFLLDEARHTGQIILLRKRLLPGSDPEFDPYVFA